MIKIWLRHFSLCNKAEYSVTVFDGVQPGFATDAGSCTDDRDNDSIGLLFFTISWKPLA